MPTRETTTDAHLPKTSENGAEIGKEVLSFKTARGSVYIYDDHGRTSRFKTVTGEQHEAQDLTVFLPLGTEQEQRLLEALHLKKVGVETKVYIIERLPDDTIKVLRKLEDISDPNRLYLGIFEDRKMLGANQVSLKPTLGYSVFDTRHFQENGKWFTDRHLGNEVTEITYEE